MLASLLPGLRHFRTPFAVGSITVFTLWVLAGDLIPERSEAHGFLERIYVLAEVAGRPIVTAAIAVVLYLIGDLVRVSTKNAENGYKRVTTHLRILSDESRVELQNFADRAYLRREPAESSPIPRTGLVRRIEHEFPEIRMRLIANHLDIYLEHDRLDSEAEFRINMALYSGNMWLALGVAWAPWLLLGLGASVVLLKNGVRALNDANAILVQAVVSGVVLSRYFEEEMQRDAAWETSENE
ncbi:hypothetical protein [Streptomyces sp. NRRL B-1140]|uniref:hypothetical protein n=1 Tax=Streptomyces sp. NRRL B-1140 TaxID=1415549 RepID=UPI00131EABE3|nr:hypothetical protein [Streptomyces sp. NRRL B-1140]